MRLSLGFNCCPGTKSNGRDGGSQPGTYFTGAPTNHRLRIPIRIKNISRFAPVVANMNHVDIERTTALRCRSLSGWRTAGAMAELGGHLNAGNVCS